jgi:hypothetical protein
MPQTYSALLKRLSDKYAAWGEVARFVADVETYSPLLVLLFGSLAREEYTQESDADVLVIFATPMDWQVVYGLSTGVVQPLVKELQEVLEKLHEGNTFFIEAFEDGVPLVDREGTYTRLRCEAESSVARFGLMREPGGWRRHGKMQPETSKASR